MRPYRFLDQDMACKEVEEMTEKDSKRSGTIFGALSVLGVAALKFKVLIFAGLKALTFLKFGWFFSSFFSLILSIGLYTMLWGFPYAIAIIVLLLIHEMGHWIWMKALGLNPKAPMFVPGLGAYVAMTNIPPDHATRAWVAFAGPLIGGLGCAILYWIGMHTDNAWCMAAGSTGFMLNLIQLIPAKPLDGGFVIAAISKWLLIPGVVILLMVAAAFHSILLLIIGVISGFSLVKQFMHPRPVSGSATSSAIGSTATAVVSEPIPATPLERFTIGVAYVSLSGMLAYMFWLSQNTVSTLAHH
jgi:Zn-dependent protease